MRNEKGAASFVGVLLALLVICLATYILLETQGILIKGEGKEQTPIEQAQLVAMHTDMRLVKQGLELYRTTNPEHSYPPTSQVNSLYDLRRLLPVAFSLRDSVTFDFVEYAGTEDDWTLRVRFHDSIGTMYEVGSKFSTREYKP